MIHGQLFKPFLGGSQNGTDTTLQTMLVTGEENLRAREFKLNLHFEGVEFPLLWFVWLV
jgi:hypothetical protein